MSWFKLRISFGEKLAGCRPGIKKNQRRFISISRKFSFRAGRPAFTLVECLIGLSLSLFILLSSVEMFNLARKFFIKLKEAGEVSLATANALEKIREDAENAGLGLEAETYFTEEQPGNFHPVLAHSGHLVFFSLEEKISLEAPAEAGQNFLTVYASKTLADRLKKGRSLILNNQRERNVELVSLVNFSGNRIYLSAPLGGDYKPEDSRVCLLEKVDYFLDLGQKILRRRVNDTSSQPLLEAALSFEFGYRPDTNVLTIRLCAGAKEEKSYELVVFPKNIFKNPWL